MGRIFNKRQPTSLVLARCNWHSVGCWHHDDQLGSTEVAHFVQLHRDGEEDALSEGSGALLRACSRNASPRGYKFVRELSVTGGGIERIGHAEGDVILEVPPLSESQPYEEVLADATHLVTTDAKDMRIEVQLVLVPDSGTAPLEGGAPRNVVHFRPPRHGKEVCPCCLASFHT